MSYATFERREIQEVTDSLVTVATGDTKDVTLASGAGYYRLIWYKQWRSAGAAAANHQAKVFDEAVAVGNATFVHASASTAAGTLIQADVDRVFYTPDGKVRWQPNPDVAGDTFQFYAVVERLR